VTAWHIVGWLNLAGLAVFWRLNRRSEKRLAATRAEQRAERMPAEMALTVRSMPPEMFTLIRPAHHVTCGQRVVATCQDRQTAERIADVLDDAGVLDLTELGV
jgi:hypothetical protein